MLRPIPAPMALAGLLVGVLLHHPAPCAELPPDIDAVEQLDDSNVYVVVKRFDFDERPLGNYEDTPMYWERLSGPGLPLYSGARFDDEFGHRAPPSFRFDLRGGSVAYEYRLNDLPVLSEADHVLVGHVRAVGLRHARAFIHVYYVDRLGQRIPASDQISPLVASKTDATATDPVEPWQRLVVPLGDKPPAAYGVRLRLWVLQRHVWQPPAASEIDPIVRQDVQATVWFDDITLYRMPRARLRFSEPGSVVPVGQSAAFHLDVHNTTALPMRMDLRVVDDRGRTLHSAAYEVAHHESERLESPAPLLPPGLYQVQLRLQDGRRLVLYRSLPFAVLPELPVRAPLHSDLGVDLGHWRRADPRGARQLVSQLGCGAAKIGVPMIGAIDTPAQAAYMDEIGQLARELIDRRVQVTGVLVVPQTVAADVPPAVSVAADVPVDSSEPTGLPRPAQGLPATSRVEGDWQPGMTAGRLLASADGAAWFGPVLAHLGGLLTSWQLGEEQAETENPTRWHPHNLRALRGKLRKFLADPEIIVPCSIFELHPPIPPVTTTDSRPQAVSIYVPASLPTAALVEQLAFLADPADHDDNQRAAAAHPARWLLVETPDAGVIRERRLADFARRLVLAKATGPDRLYIPAPFGQTGGAGGGPAWYPQAEYLVARTLMHFLSGQKAAAAMAFPDVAGVALVFDDPDRGGRRPVDREAETWERGNVGMEGSGRRPVGRPNRTCLVVWTWRDEPPVEPLKLYLGPDPVMTDLWGTRTALVVKEGRAQVPLAPMPVIVYGVDAPLALLQASFAVEPTFVQLHDPEPRPVLKLRNYYDRELIGTLHFALPEDWRVNPPTVHFALEPGQTLAWPLDLELPPSQIAADVPLAVTVETDSPRIQTLEFVVPLTVGLRDIHVEVKTRWAGDDLVVEQSLHNATGRVVSFAAYCRVPQRAQVDGAFLEVNPGETQIQRYVYPQARDLSGAPMRLGVREILGPRSLDQLVEIPR